MSKTGTKTASFAALDKSQIELLAKNGLDREIISLAESVAKEDGISLGEWLLIQCRSAAATLRA